MRAVCQGVSSARVTVAGRCASRIGAGLLVYLGIGQDDTPADSDYLARKVRYLRVFEDADGRWNRDVVEAGGRVLVVSAFTLLADARKGRRPAFTAAAPAESARALYDRFCTGLTDHGVSVERGVFRETMTVESANEGPVCILLDSRRHF